MGAMYIETSYTFVNNIFFFLSYPLLDKDFRRKCNLTVQLWLGNNFQDKITQGMLHSKSPELNILSKCIVPVAERKTQQ